jgi:hypothetical protein
MIAGLEWVLFTILLTPWFVLGTLGVAFWCLKEECFKSSVFFTFAALATGMYLLDVPLKCIGYFAAVYIPVGIVWCYYRWIRYTQDVTQKFNDEVARIKGSSYYDTQEKEASLQSIQKFTNETALEITQQKARVTSWVFAWPISIIENVAGDLIATVQRVITVHCRKMFDAVSNKARADMVSISMEATESKTEVVE